MIFLIEVEICDGNCGQCTRYDCPVFEFMED